MIKRLAECEILNCANANGAFKAAMMNYGKDQADAQAPKQIRVNTRAPGPVYVEGNAWTGIKANMPEFYEKILNSIPMGRMGSPADIANAVTFLCSDAAQYITGTPITVDGGRTRAVHYCSRTLNADTRPAPLSSPGTARPEQTNPPP